MINQRLVRNETNVFVIVKLFSCFSPFFTFLDVFKVFFTTRLHLTSPKRRNKSSDIECRGDLLHPKTYFFCSSIYAVYRDQSYVYVRLNFDDLRPIIIEKG